MKQKKIKYAIILKSIKPMCLDYENDEEAKKGFAEFISDDFGSLNDLLVLRQIMPDGTSKDIMNIDGDIL